MTPSMSSSGRDAALALHRVGKHYPVADGTLSVLDGVDLALAPGEFLSVVGASGCGKSTLLRLIVGLDRDFEGDILINGRPVDGPGLERGMVFQDHRLFPWLTVAANIGLGLDSMSLSPRARRARIDDMIGLVGLTGFADAFPHQLSGGMAQRAAIARALVSEPQMLLMDEPFGALDSLTRIYLQEELLRIWMERQVTVIVVTHDVDEALFLSDTLLLMAPRPGRVQARIEVDLPRPRDRSLPEFGALKQQILAQLRR
ncbi:ABC transporter ATP-binding protein [Pigmentiphaga litoralis]|uniref:ABC-type nitrate/sulfonate/bicarbonate transport system ATPase subunit n=1 Tax=Pigmentiphaga litoralis TaxID=516702 RepID=A0A7Y9IU23_9BURK|nr:ABC transporter ATP-binding protein [Pigmentiphaga litoralis]NYE23427.1 ABC-type nitrate/sulfonate/bicarbonate transport system ATPase subunit [Pigmentiphaga litoralis]NYE82959.1 ABC-type nitrate/sulfonate/bicarbonate transport system ATPase subunit [Pigmentiphaga litoralis]